MSQPHQHHAQGGHAYEISLSGEFFPKDLKPILNRFTLHSESAQPIHIQEYTFDPPYAEARKKAGMEVIQMRAKRAVTVNEGATGDGEFWEFYSYLKPESTRQYPDVTVRPWATVQVANDATGFASALGYSISQTIFKRGYSFRRGNLVILMFQQEQEDTATGKPIPAHPDTLWQVEVRTAQPIRDTPVKQAIEELLQVQTLMKGLLDLRRQG